MLLNDSKMRNYEKDLEGWGTAEGNKTREPAINIIAGDIREIRQNYSEVLFRLLALEERLQGARPTNCSESKTVEPDGIIGRLSHDVEDLRNTYIEIQGVLDNLDTLI